MRITRWSAVPLGLALLTAACVEQPTGPTVRVMPNPNKPFEVFQADDDACRHYAQAQLGQSAQNAEDRSIGSAIAGTAIGAAAGALLGRSGGSTAAGAGIGLVAGSAVGAGSADRSSYGLQRTYNIAYEQCMYAKGDQVPGYRGYAPPPPPGYYPPPPGYYPPPPPPPPQ